MTLPSRKPLDAIFEVELPPAPYPGLRPFEPEESGRSSSAGKS